jgi:hypothetical protein
VESSSLAKPKCSVASGCGFTPLLLEGLWRLTIEGRPDVLCRHGVCADLSSQKHLNSGDPQ